MRYEWSLFELHGIISLERQLTELKRVLGRRLQLDVISINEHTTRMELLQEQDDNISRFILFCDTKMQVPMVLCFTGEDQFIQLLCSWLKSEGIIVFSIELNTRSMLSLADKIIGLEYYDLKFIFEVVTLDRNLRKIELEVDKKSFEKVTKGLTSCNSLRNGVVPYIYQRSGMIIERLPLSAIILSGVASITCDKVFINSWTNEVLEGLLRLIQ